MRLLRLIGLGTQNGTKCSFLADFGSGIWNLEEMARMWVGCEKVVAERIRCGVVLDDRAQ
jgi:hypothetical protein